MKKFAKVMALAMVAVLSLAALVACGPASDPDKAEAALKENEYVTLKSTVLVKGLTVIGINGVTASVTGTKVTEDSSEVIFILYFNNNQSANESWDSAQKNIKKIMDTLQIEYKGDDSDLTIKKSGAMIYCGTAAGIKAAR